MNKTSADHKYALISPKNNDTSFTSFQKNDTSLNYHHLGHKLSITSNNIYNNKRFDFRSSSNENPHSNKNSLEKK